jgi:hypothetical protein
MNKRKSSQPCGLAKNKQSKLESFLSCKNEKQQLGTSSDVDSQKRALNPRPTIVNESIPAGNAFHALMKGARDAVPRKEIFTINLDSSDAMQGNGSWSWAWAKSDSGAAGIGGDASMKWRCLQNVRYPNGCGSSVLTLMTDIQSADSANSKQTRLTPSLLKSAMQKNVRLCRVTESAIVGKELQGASMIEFLRRLAIIILEDAILHPALPLVVWSLIAHSQKDGSQFRPPPLLTAALLTVVADVARVGIRDPIDAAEVLSRSGGFPGNFEQDLDCLQPQEQVQPTFLRARAYVATNAYVFVISARTRRHSDLFACTYAHADEGSSPTAAHDVYPPPIHTQEHPFTRIPLTPPPPPSLRTHSFSSLVTAFSPRRPTHRPSSGACWRAAVSAGWGA